MCGLLFEDCDDIVEGFERVQEGVLAAEPLEESAAGKDRGCQPGGRDVASAVADVRDEIAGIAEGAGVAQLEAFLQLNPARAEVAHAPAVGKGGPAGVTHQPVEPMGIEDGVDVKVEPVADDDGHPVIPVGPVDQLEEAGPQAGNLEGEGAQLVGIRLDRFEGGGVVLLDRELAGAEPPFEFAPAGPGEPLEDLAGDIVEDDGIVEVEADEIGHGDSFARRARAARRMRLERARYLASREGKAALEGLDVDLEGLEPHRLAALFRRRYPPEEAAALGEQVALRARARARFGHLPLTVFSGEGLEMLTHPAVAARRAERLAGYGLPVVDLTCGLGGDLAAVATRCDSAVGVENDAATATLAAVNVPGRVVLGDAAAPPAAIERAAVVLDPARRAGGSRIFDPAACTPPWDVCVTLARRARAAVIKAAPGLDHARAGGDAEIEAVQLGRELKELSLWYGEGARPGLRRAVLLPGDVVIESGEHAPEVGMGAPGRYLFDPESCVTRAGLVRELAVRLGAWQLDARVAYLTGDRPVFHPLTATFEVLEAVPFSANRLRGWLRERGLRPGEIRRRAFPVEPDELRRLLGRLEGEPVALLCATVGRERLVFAARRLGPAGGEGG